MSYANYCQDQGMDCARRARLASSSEVAIYWRHLAFRWIGLAEQADSPGTWFNGNDEKEGISFRCSDLDLERETRNAKANADARKL
jgi:hypothetical protein